MRLNDKFEKEKKGRSKQRRKSEKRWQMLERKEKRGGAPVVYKERN